MQCLLNLVDVGLCVLRGFLRRLPFCRCLFGGRLLGSGFLSSGSFLLCWLFLGRSFLGGWNGLLLCL
jgi:hypothetical protein